MLFVVPRQVNLCVQRRDVSNGVYMLTLVLGFDLRNIDLVVRFCAVDEWVKVECAGHDALVVGARPVAYSSVGIDPKLSA